MHEREERARQEHNIINTLFMISATTAALRAGSPGRACAKDLKYKI
jgi:hypothetical protein